MTERSFAERAAFMTAAALDMRNSCDVLAHVLEVVDREAAAMQKAAERFAKRAPEKALRRK